MVDYIKISLIRVDIIHLLDRLDFKTVVSERTGELSSKKIAEYHFCKITIYDTGTILFTGSIHKLYNSLKRIKAPNHKRIKQYKGFNGNQFTINDILEVREHLQNLFDCTPQQMVFQNIELGVNLTLDFTPELYLKGLLYHKGILFEYRYKGNLAQAKHQRFIFKIYNKSEQYGMSENVLRVELKIVKTEELKSIGIITFADINTYTLNKAKEMLLKRFDEVVHYDYTINKKSLTKKQKQDLKKFSNPRYWVNDLEPNRRDRPKNRLLKITKKYSDNLHQKIRQEIVKKCVTCNRLSENPKCVIDNSSSIVLSITHSTNEIPIKKCTVTGATLKYEKQGTKYLRTTTLLYLYHNNQKKFIELCSMLLNKTKGRPKFERNIISHLAKQIRNRYYNPIIIKKVGYNQKQYPNQLRLSI